MRRDSDVNEAHDWLVFHRVRFREPVDGRGNPFPGPARADAWRFYPASPIGDDGMRTGVSDHWGGFGLYSRREDAEAVFAAPEEHLAFLDRTVEAWHALVLPVSHRGKVAWRGSLLDGTTIKPASADPGGPLVVFTSANYYEITPDDLDRVRKFIYEVDRVQDYYGTLPGNVRRAVFSGATVDGVEGMTVTLWRDDTSMLEAAYGDGHHKDQIAYQRTVGHFDYSSFTRARILASTGTWGGTDPVTQMH
jgi:hypothetical protein